MSVGLPVFVFQQSTNSFISRKPPHRGHFGLSCCSVSASALMSDGSALTLNVDDLLTVFSPLIEKEDYGFSQPYGNLIITFPSISVNFNRPSDNSSTWTPASFRIWSEISLSWLMTAINDCRCGLSHSKFTRRPTSNAFKWISKHLGNDRVSHPK